MIGLPLLRGKNLLGIDIGGYSVKAVLLKGDADRYILDAAATIKLHAPVTSADSNDGAASIIADLMQVQKISTKKAATIVAPQSLVIRNLSLPDMPESDLKEAVKWELRKDVTLQQTDFVCDFIINSKSTDEDKTVDVTAFAASRADVLNTIETLENASLMPRVVDTHPTALLNAFNANNFWDTDKNYAMIDIGAGETTLAVFRNMGLEFVRTINFGGELLTEQVASALATNKDEAEKAKIEFGIGDSKRKKALSVRAALEPSALLLSTELKRSFEYFQTRFKRGAIDKLFLSGGTALMPGLTGQLSNSLDIETFIFNPFSNIEIPGDIPFEPIDSVAPVYTVATGLATRKEML